MLWVSLLLVLIIIAVNFMTVLKQVKVHAARQDLQRSLTEGFKRGKVQEEEKKKD